MVFQMWSYSRMAWRLPDSAGYTHVQEDAGEYTCEEAKDIMEECNTKDIIAEIMVPVVHSD